MVAALVLDARNASVYPYVVPGNVSSVKEESEPEERTMKQQNVVMYVQPG